MHNVEPKENGLPDIFSDNIRFFPNVNDRIFRPVSNITQLEDCV